MRLRTLGVIIGLLAGQSAAAQDCETAYTMDSLLTDLAMIEGALRGGDHASANEGATRMADGMECIDDIVPSVMVGRLYRAVGGGIFVGGDPDVGLAWMRTAAEVDGAFEYGEGDLPADHPARSGWKLAKVEVMGTEPTLLEGAEAFAPGSHFLDGRPITEPAAGLERIHVYQRSHEDQLLSARMQGNAFPEIAFGDPAPAEPLPPEPDPNEAADPEEPEKPVKEPKERSGNWPASRVFMVAGGAASLGASGALYGMSAGARSNFDQSNSVPDMDKFRGSANATFISSGVAGVTGVSMIGMGLFFSTVDGDPRPTLDIRF